MFLSVILLAAALTCTRSKPLYRADFPLFDWPSAPFPSLKYPLEEHADENAVEEERCIDKVRGHLFFNDFAVIYRLSKKPVKSHINLSFMLLLLSVVVDPSLVYFVKLGAVADWNFVSVWWDVLAATASAAFN